MNTIDKTLTEPHTLVSVSGMFENSKKQVGYNHDKIEEIMTLPQRIIQLWHVSRTALATSSSSRYDRMIYVKKSLVEHYHELLTHIGTGKHLWFAIEDAIN